MCFSVPLVVGMLIYVWFVLAGALYDYIRAPFKWFLECVVNPGDYLLRESGLSSSYGPGDFLHVGLSVAASWFAASLGIIVLLKLATVRRRVRIFPLGQAGGDRTASLSGCTDGGGDAISSSAPYPMSDFGPIDLRALVDLDALAAKGAMHYTFLAFPTSSVNRHGVPSDAEAQRFIAAVQSTGVPVGIWVHTPIDGTSFAAVTGENISRLHEALRGLPEFSGDYLTSLCDRLFREDKEGGS